MLDRLTFRIACNLFRLFIRLTNIGKWEEVYSWSAEYIDGFKKPIFKVYRTKDGIFKRVECYWWRAYAFFDSINAIRMLYEVGFITDEEFKEALEEDSDIEKIYKRGVERLHARKENKCQIISHVQ